MKFCGKCNKTKPTEQFSRNRSRYDGLQSQCKECKKNLDAKYYKSNPKAFRKSKKRGVAKKKKYVQSILERSACADCGNDDIVVLEFDHVTEDKFKGVMQLVNEGYSMQRLKDEIEKCEVVCANCHKRRTYKRLGNTWRMGC